MKKIVLFLIALCLLLLQTSCVSITYKGQINTNDTASDMANSDDTEPETDITQPVSIMPDQSYIGAWSTDEYRTDEILIYEIASDSIKFETGIFREFGFRAAAIEHDGEIAFGDGISPDYSGPEGLKGRIKFEDDGIILIYDSFGCFDDIHSGGSNVYRFTNKYDESDRIVEFYQGKEIS